jgi:membrane associated rhomboid family serine protease
MSSQLVPVAEGFAVQVAEERRARAAEVLDAYESENPERDAEARTTPPAPPFSPVGCAVAGLLVAFFLVTGVRDPEVVWFARGSADATRILAGESWRCVTALTLHADLRHVLSNAVSGTLFFGFVCAALGPGLGLALIVLAGAAGNFANALFHGGGHVSVGASTAVFAALGVLCALRFASRRQREPRARRVWIALGAGLALLAMLGTSGERVDLWAHLFGLAAGLVIGLPAALFAQTPTSPLLQWGLAAAVTLAVVSSWTAALY